MPTLIMHVVCEKAIFDKDGMPSVINIFRTINFQVQDAPLPAGALAPVRWSIFTIWNHPFSERGKTYVQKTEIILPNGEMFGASPRIPFTVTGEDDYSSQSKNHAEVTGMPIQEGRFLVRALLEGLPECQAEYEFFVKFIPKGATNAEPEATSTSVH